MVFSSFYFLLYFMPLFFISYYVVDCKYKNLCVFLFSIFFYAFSCFDNIYYVFLLLASLVINYFIALQIEKADRYKILLLVISLIINFGNLFVFKYLNFFVRILGLANIRLPFEVPTLLLPIGISFYTFQIVSYVVDVFFKKIEAEKNFVNFGTYVIMFPQLIAGPILRFKDIMKEIREDRHILFDEFFDGLYTFVVGLTSKVLVANQLSLVAVDVGNFGVEKLSILGAWGVSIAYSMQMYFDFFGYSLMAIGLGRMMGFTITKNFRDPFLSKSVTEYWRRWHITLGTWFKDYVLYPILLSKPMRFLRKVFDKAIGLKLSNVILNIFATFFVWLFTGLWHGANFNFLIWGMYFFVLLSIEQIFLYKFLNKSKIISHIYLLVVIIISFTIFSNEDLNAMVITIKRMFGQEASLINDAFYKTIANNYKSLILGVLCVLRLPNLLYKVIKDNVFLKVLSFIILLAVDLGLIYLGYNDPFLYFRF